MSLPSKTKNKFDIPNKNIYLCLMKKKTITFDANDAKIKPRSTDNLEIECTVYIDEVISEFTPEEIVHGCDNISGILDEIDCEEIVKEFYDPSGLVDELKLKYPELFNTKEDE